MSMVNLSDIDEKQHEKAHKLAKLLVQTVLNFVEREGDVSLSMAVVPATEMFSLALRGFAVQDCEMPMMILVQATQEAMGCHLEAKGIFSEETNQKLMMAFDNALMDSMDEVDDKICMQGGEA
jgi:hypothetical protein